MHSAGVDPDDAARAQRAKLRVGVLLDAGDPPAWIAEIIREVQASEVAHIVAVIRRGDPRPPARESIGPRVLRGVYDAFDARVFELARDPFAPVPVAELLADAQVIVVRGGIAGALAELEALRLDVALELGFGALDGALAIARFGVWSYQHGDEHASLGGPAGFSEVLTHAPVTTAALHRVTTDGRRVLYQSWSSTDPRSVRRNRALTYWKSSAFALRALRELFEGGPAAFDHGPPATLISAAAPSGARVAAGLARFGTSVVRERMQRLLTRKQWLLAYGIDRTLRGAVPSQALAAMTWIVPPRDRIWADPFVARHGDGWVVVFEEKLYTERNARISAFEIDRNGVVGEPYPVLERDYHLSYPFLFEWNSAWWMVPESSRNQTIELWRATDFPRRWTLERTLIADIRAVDATLFEHAGRWWMFCNVGEAGASKDDELHLFHAATPLGPWTPHPRNPIKSDVRGARPAGRPFWTEGAWYRPAQDSSAGYGSSLVLQRIDRLDERGYAETEHARLAPSFAPGLIGLHTINAADGLTVIDLRLERPRLALLDRLQLTRR